MKGSEQFKTAVILVGYINILAYSLIVEGIQYQTQAINSWGDLLIQNNKIEVMELDRQAYYDTLEYYDTDYIEPVDEWSKARETIANQFPTSPLLDKLELFGEYNIKSKLALAIAGTESGFGTNGFIATKCFNAWGYLYEGTQKRGCYGSNWSSWDKSIPRYMQVADNWLSSFDGTRQDLNSFVGSGKYCASGCTTWIDSTWNFYSQF